MAESSTHTICKFKVEHIEGDSRRHKGLEVEYYKEE